MELKAAICPYCSGDLKIPEDRKNIMCMYCGKQIIVKEAIEKAIGPKIENYFCLAKATQKSSNNEEAYK